MLRRTSRPSFLPPEVQKTLLDELPVLESAEEIRALLLRLGLPEMRHEQRVDLWQLVGKVAGAMDIPLALEVARNVRPAILLKNRKVTREVLQAVGGWLVRTHLHPPMEGGWICRPGKVVTEAAAFASEGLLSQETPEMKRLWARSRGGESFYSSDLRIWLALADAPLEALLAGVKQSDMNLARRAIRHPQATPEVWRMAVQYGEQFRRHEVRLALASVPGAWREPLVRSALFEMAAKDDTRLLPLLPPPPEEERLSVLKELLTYRLFGAAEEMLQGAGGKWASSLPQCEQLAILSSPAPGVRRTMMLLIGRGQEEKLELALPTTLPVAPTRKRGR